MVILNDKKLFAIILYSAFVNHGFLTPVRNIWENHWATGTAAAFAIGIAGLIVAPMILMAIISALGFGAEGVAAGTFGSWFMSLYNGAIARGSLVSILQSIGAAGLGALSTSIISGLGAAIGILIGAAVGPKLADYLREIDLNLHENQSLDSFVQIEEINNMVIFSLMPVLLYNDTILNCFVETFVSGSYFAYSELFRFNFKENDLSVLKSEEERVNHTVYNLLVKNYEKSRINYIFYDDYLIGYDLNLKNHKPSDSKIILLTEIWKYINGVIVIDIDVDNILHQIGQFLHDQYQAIGNFFHNFHF